MRCMGGRGKPGLLSGPKPFSTLAARGGSEEGACGQGSGGAAKLRARRTRAGPRPGEGAPRRQRRPGRRSRQAAHQPPKLPSASPNCVHDNPSPVSRAGTLDRDSTVRARANSGEHAGGRSQQTVPAVAPLKQPQLTPEPEVSGWGDTVAYDSDLQQNGQALSPAA